MSQPLFFIILVFGIVALIIFPFIPYNTFGEDVKMLKDSGLMLIPILSLILALWTSSVSVSEEIEGRTALTLLSKPVGRKQFIFGKFLGVVFPVAVLFIVLGAIFLATISYKVVYDARETSNPEPSSAQCTYEMLKTTPGLVLAFFRGGRAGVDQRRHFNAASNRAQPDHLLHRLHAGALCTDTCRILGGAVRVGPILRPPPGGPSCRSWTISTSPPRSPPARSSLGPTSAGPASTPLLCCSAAILLSLLLFEDRDLA